MSLSPDQAVRQAKELLQYHEPERSRLDLIRRYWMGRQRMPAVIPQSASREVQEMAKVARVNVCSIVVESMTQSLFVDGFRTEVERDGDTFDENAPAWETWQANKMDRGQSSVHRAALAYGTSYVVVTPGDPLPVLTPRSPRKLCAMYGEDRDWPEYALERPRTRGGPWRLYDDAYVHKLELRAGNGSTSGEFARRPDSTATHGLGFCPVVRYRDLEDDDLDDEPAADYRYGYHDDVIVAGQVAPLIPLQDQVDITTFGLMTAQYYSAFRQRYILGWVAESEAKLLKFGSDRLWTFKDHPDDVKPGEFSQTELKGYIDSREMSLKHAATLSQTPVHELIGEIVNVSADALAAIEAGRDRKADERKAGLGESHEQMFWVVGRLTDTVMSDDAQVIWRDTSARSLAATVDALGKEVQMLGWPQEMAWEQIPGRTQQDIRRALRLREKADAFASLEQMLTRQAESAVEPPLGNGETQTGNGLILPAGVR